MTHRQPISISPSRIVVSLLLMLCSLTAGAQGILKLQRDSIPLFRGFALSFDLVGAAQKMLSDHGQYEGAFRLNLHDQFFPIVEVGYGYASHEDDEVTTISYHTSAPYFRAGIDVNVMKKKHTGNRVYVGLRAAHTSYKVDVSAQSFIDPTWKRTTTYGIKDEPCSQTWAEFLFGIDAKIFGPLHLGWSARYKMRLAHDDGLMGKTWYVPGYGMQDGSAMGVTFNVIIDI